MRVDKTCPNYGEYIPKPCIYYAYKQRNKETMIHSRNKGKRFELEVSKALKALGFLDARRAQQYAGGVDSADVIGVDGFHIECKMAREAIRLNKSWEQINRDKGDKKGLLVWRVNKGKMHVDLLFEDLVELVDRVLEARNSLNSKE